jgi:hypothetical protein
VYLFAAPTHIPSPLNFYTSKFYGERVRSAGVPRAVWQFGLGLAIARATLRYLPARCAVKHGAILCGDAVLKRSWNFQPLLTQTTVYSLYALQLCQKGDRLEACPTFH